MKPTCPICLEEFKACSSFTLDCGHKTCMHCSLKWLVKNPSCPLCRTKTATLSKNTRSKARRARVIRQLYDGLERAKNLPCQCIEGGPLCPSRETRLLIERYVLRDKVVWRRTDMIKHLIGLKQISIRAIVALNRNQSKENKRLVTVLKELLQI